MSYALWFWNSQAEALIILHSHLSYQMLIFLPPAAVRANTSSLSARYEGGGGVVVGVNVTSNWLRLLRETHCPIKHQRWTGFCHVVLTNICCSLERCSAGSWKTSQVIHLTTHIHWRRTSQAHLQGTKTCSATCGSRTTERLNVRVKSDACVVRWRH